MSHIPRTLSVTAIALVAAFTATVRVGKGQIPTPTSRSAPPAAMFVPGRECLACHNNLVSPLGEDVSIGASWRGTMMANSARDPYVQASVRRETTDHPSHAATIEDECAACHLPAARQIAHAAGAKGQVFAHLTAAATNEASDLDTLALDGVTCTVCHQIAPDGLGERFNGDFLVAGPTPDGSRRAFGPKDPEPGRRRIMHSVTGFEQQQAPHVRESSLCATCHTLVTEALGPDGSVIGSLPEQMNFQEWQHSAFYAERRSCQSCHMPSVAGPVRIASVLGEERESLSRHVFIGGNAFMLRLLNRFRDELGLEATSQELDATARLTERQLQHDTATIAIDRASFGNGALNIDVVVKNIAGHKFPTGYPSRRAWLHLVVRDEAGRAVFESGRVTAEGRIEGNDGDEAADRYERHYEEITRPDEVQIYESVMGTSAGVPTTGLLQATRYLKDNRLLPRGFDKATAPANIAVVGSAVDDSNFTGEGDRVRYRVPLAADRVVTVEVELRYQSIAYRWAHNLEPYRAAETLRFVGYYNVMAASSSTLVATASGRVSQPLGF